MPASIGVNLRVTGHCRQGGRKYMEDFFSVAYQQTEDERDLEYAFFGIYDGHGGAEAAAFAKEHLMEAIIKHRNFWSNNDEDVLRAIKDGYITTHYNMWKEQEKWPKTTAGLPSTAGTTASVAFIRRGKIYIGHVGDSAIILGYQENGSSEWKAKQLTKDHKPENEEEMSRIEQCGGKVIAKSGVPRVVWNRPRIGHQGPVRRSTPIDEIPFLAVARSLGDLWSYNSQNDQFIVSPDPDCSVMTIDCNTHRCLIFGTDGLFNMLSPQMAVHIVQQAERHNENAALSDNVNKTWLNPSKLLVEKALERWHNTKIRADNTSVVTLMLDPPGPPRAQVLKNRKKNAYPDSGLEIMTRYENEKQANDGCLNCQTSENTDAPTSSICNIENPLKGIKDINIKDIIITNSKEERKEKEHESLSTGRVPSPSTYDNDNSAVSSSNNTNMVISPLKERNFVPKTRESTSFDPRDECSSAENEGKENCKSKPTEEDDTIQINEISSSSSDLFEACREELNRNEKSAKPNLRSNNLKPKVALKESNGSDKASRSQENCTDSRPSTSFDTSTRKRKFNDENMFPVRKSIRIDSRRTLPPNVHLHATCCGHYDGHELKRQQNHSKIKHIKSLKPKLSVPQRILKSKKLLNRERNKILVEEGKFPIRKNTRVISRKNLQGGVSDLVLKGKRVERKLSLAQKIIKSKKNLLKKTKVKKPTTKGKVKFVIDTIRSAPKKIKRIRKKRSINTNRSNIKFRNDKKDITIMKSQRSSSEPRKKNSSDVITRSVSSDAVTTSELSPRLTRRASSGQIGLHQIGVQPLSAKIKKEGTLKHRERNLNSTIDQGDKEQKPPQNSLKNLKSTTMSLRSIEQNPVPRFSMRTRFLKKAVQDQGGKAALRKKTK